MKTILAVFTLLHIAYCDVSHIINGPSNYAEYEHGELITSTTTPPPPPRPYAFGYAAGRFPGHIDRTHTEISDGSGVVRGSYSYVDPKFRIRTVDYVADRNGFHPVLNTPQRPLPSDSPIVAAAKEKHLRQFAAIAESHQAGIAQYPLPHDSASVANAKAKHYDLYQRIAQQHAQIAAEREAERAVTADPNEIGLKEHQLY